MYSFSGTTCICSLYLLSASGCFCVCFKYFILFFSFIFISWRLITLQYRSGFCHTLTWIRLTCIPHPIPPPTFLSTRSPWVFPVHQARALVSCIQPGLVISFTIDNIHVLMPFSQNIPPSSGCFLKQWFLIIISSYLLMMYMDGIDFFFYEPYISLNPILILPTWKMMIYPLRCGSNFIEFLNALGN